MGGWIWVEFVQVRLLSNVVSSVPYVDRSRAADGVIRLLRGAIAGYSLGERRETVAFENELVRSSSRKTFIWGWIWVEFVQVRVRPNMVLSVPYVDRSRAADGVIRLLRGAIAVISKRSIQPSTGSDCDH